jgi:hypothetical protein
MPRSFLTPIDLPEQAAPSTPPSGLVRKYAKAGGHLYAKDSSGNEYDLCYPEEIAVFSLSGALTVGTGVGRFRFPFAATIIGVTAAINTAPTGASAIFDVKKNGTTIFSTTTNRPTIAAGANATTSEPAPDVTAIAAGDYLTVDRSQIGSTVAGSDATLFVRYRRA